MSELLDVLLKAIDSGAVSGLDYVELRADDVVQTSVELCESAIQNLSHNSPSVLFKDVKVTTG